MRYIPLVAPGCQRGAVHLGQERSKELEAVLIGGKGSASGSRSAERAGIAVDSDGEGRAR